MKSGTVVIPSILFLTILLSSCAGSAEIASKQDPTDPVLAVINGQTLGVVEYEFQYSRTSSAQDAASTDSIEALEDFLERYINFRVKVLEARVAGYDMQEDFITEIGGYRTQLARPYLLEHEVMEPLIREMYERRKEAVNASHILISVSGSATPADTLSAHSKISAIRDSVVTGSDFGIMAARYSMDPSAKGASGTSGHQGNLGFFGGGRMVKDFEDYAFTLAVGSVSPVFRTRFGYHILKVNDRIPLPADRHIAHIMIRPHAQTAADSADADQRTLSVIARLSDGENFSDVARDMSDDGNSGRNGGDLGVLSFDAGLPFQFRDAAFAIEHPGDYTGPVQSAFGIHFIHFLEESSLGSFEEEYEDLKAQVNRLPRAKEAENQFARSVRDKLGSWIDSTVVDKWTRSMTADSLFRLLAQNSFSSEDSSAVFSTLGTESFTVSDFADYFSTGRLPSAPTLEARIYAIADKFLNEKALSRKVELLEQSDFEFARTMQDFRDGLILFRLMEDSVWTAAASDSAGLHNYYEDNRANYQFSDRIRIISFSSSSDSLISGLVEKYRSQSPAAFRAWATQDDSISIRIDTTYISGKSGSIYDQVFDLSEGEITDPIPYNRGFIGLLHSGTDPARPMNFSEARASLVSDYQNIVESKLMLRLREKYDVETFPENLRFVFNQSEPPNDKDE